MADTVDERQRPTPPTVTRRRRFRLPGSAAALVVYFVTLILILIVYNALLDRYTPITGDGYVQAYVTRIAPQVDGVVTAVRVEDNQRVDAGELLFELDDRPYAFAVDQSRAGLALAQKEVALLQRDLDLATEVITQVEADLAFAQKEFERFSKTARDGASPMVELDRSRDRLTNQRALLGEARAKRTKAEENLAAKVGDVNALVAKAQADLKHATYNLDRAKIAAPSKGIVTNLQLTPGTYVSAGQPVLTFIDTNAWWIIANIRENSLPRLRPGLSAEVALSLAPGRIFDAVVESIGWGVSDGQGIPSGDLPDVTAPTDWVSSAQRFPVRFRLTGESSNAPLRVGGAVTTVIYTTDNVILSGLAGFWIRVSSVLNYIY